MKNALDVMTAEVEEAEDPRFVDSVDGHVQSIKASGMAPVYAAQKTFGRVPQYLSRYKKEREAEEAKWEAEKRAEAERIEAMRLSDAERESILTGLKTNWSEVHHQYQKLSLLTDTLPKKLKREQIESQLDQLEKFVSLIEKHPIIIVADNPYQVF